MPNWLKFLTDACWRERSLFGRVVQGVAVTAPGLATLFLGWHKEDLPWWIWLGLLLTGVLLALIFGVFREAYTLWLERQPKVSIRPSVHVEPKGSDRGLRTLRLEIENESTLHLRNCSLREYRFVNQYGQPSGMQRYFRLTEDHFAKMGTHTFKRKFDLLGKGSREIIEIALLDETKNDTNVIMLYATEPTSHTLNSIPRRFFAHELEVMFTADNMAIPVRRTYRLVVSGDGILEMTPVSAAVSV